jgi:hypothetical protein
MAAVIALLALRVGGVFVTSSGGMGMTGVFVHLLLRYLPNPINAYIGAGHPASATPHVYALMMSAAYPLQQAFGEALNKSSSRGAK